MGESEAHFRVSLGSGTFEVSGSQEFVEGQIEKHGDTLSDLLNKLQQVRVGVNSGSSETNIDTPPNDEPTNTGSNVDKPFENVLAFDDENGVSVIVSIPGKNSKEKTVNAGLLYLLGKDLVGETKVPFKEIRQVCTDHGFLDSSNFAQSIKSERSLFVVSGSGQSQEAKLTVPGKKAARELAEALENQ